MNHKIIDWSLIERECVSKWLSACANVLGCMFVCVRKLFCHVEAVVCLCFACHTTVCYFSWAPWCCCCKSATLSLFSSLTASPTIVFKTHWSFQELLFITSLVLWCILSPPYYLTNVIWHNETALPRRCKNVIMQQASTLSMTLIYIHQWPIFPSISSLLNSSPWRAHVGNINQYHVFTKIDSFPTCVNDFTLQQFCATLFNFACRMVELVVRLHQTLQQLEGHIRHDLPSISLEFSLKSVEDIPKRLQKLADNVAAFVEFQHCRQFVTFYGPQ